MTTLCCIQHCIVLKYHPQYQSRIQCRIITLNSLFPDFSLFWPICGLTDRGCIGTSTSQLFNSWLHFLCSICRHHLPHFISTKNMISSWIAVIAFENIWQWVECHFRMACHMNYYKHLFYTRNCLPKMLKSALNYSRFQTSPITQTSLMLNVYTWLTVSKYDFSFL